MDNILEAYPQIRKEDIFACIAYGSAMSKEHFVDIKINAA